MNGLTRTATFTFSAIFLSSLQYSFESLSSTDFAIAKMQWKGRGHHVVFRACSVANYHVTNNNDVILLKTAALIRSAQEYSTKSEYRVATLLHFAKSNLQATEHRDKDAYGCSYCFGSRCVRLLRLQPPATKSKLLAPPRGRLNLIKIFCVHFCIMWYS